MIDVRNRYYEKHRQEVIDRAAQWQKDHPEARSEIRMKWKMSHPEYCRQYYRTHKTQIKAKKREWYAKNRLHSRLSSREWRRKKAESYLEIIHSFIGSKCAVCGYADKRALQLDHINGGGSEEYRSFKKNYVKFLKFYADNPELTRGRLQILCANCNRIKAIENQETLAWAQKYWPL